MKALLHIAARSAWNRRGTLALVMLSIALATALLLGLERLRTDIRSSFSLACWAWSDCAPTSAAASRWRSAAPTSSSARARARCS
jgi:hypothetical protein